MPEKIEMVTINLLGRDYQISCPSEEEDALLKAAKFLNNKMEKIKSHGSTLAFEKLAVMTALNLSHDLMEHSITNDVLESESQNQIKSLNDKLEAALQSSRQLEI